MRMILARFDRVIELEVLLKMEMESEWEEREKGEAWRYKKRQQKTDDSYGWQTL